jgi:hypothetical protein
MADLLPPRELRPNFLRMDSRIHPGNEKVIEHVGALGDEAVMISCHRFDQAFDEVSDFIPSRAPICCFLIGDKCIAVRSTTRDRCPVGAACKEVIPDTPDL